MLTFIETFLKELDNNNINYVHWKSNTNIEFALNGIDDLDILVSPLDQKKIFKVFKKLQIIRAFSEKDSWQDGITHFIGLDISSQLLVHIHLHFKLTLGYDFDKCFDLPIVASYLKSKHFHNSIIYLPSVEHEFIILVIRLMLKNSLTPFLLLLPSEQIRIFRQGKNHGIVSGGGFNEYVDLKAKVNMNKLFTVLKNDFPFLEKQIFIDCAKVINENNNLFNYFTYGRKLKRGLRSQSTHSEAMTFIVSFYRLNKIRVYSLLSKLRIYKKNEGKKAERGGRIIAFIGGDGAGKSTTISNLSKTLKKQFAVKNIHIGKPRKYFVGAFLFILGNGLKVLKINDLSRAILFLATAFNRKNEFKNACRLRDKGYIVLQDRMPIEGLTAMDSPKIHTIENGKFKFLSKIEQRQYKNIKGIDLLVVLKLNPEIALKRRPEDNPDELRIRSGQIWERNWDFEYAITINTEHSNVQEVQEILSAAVWDNLNASFLRTELIGLNGTGKSTLLLKIKETYSNVITVIPIRQYPKVIIFCLFRYSLRAIAVYMKTKNAAFFKSYLHFQISKNIIIKWQKKGIPASHIILDQGVLFHLVLLYNEKLISLKKFNSEYSIVIEFFSLVVCLKASEEMLFSRVQKRISSNGRGQNMNYQEFKIFCDDYNNIYNLILNNSKKNVIIDTGILSVEESLSTIIKINNE
ncbi:hypothetical protein FLAN108750_02040 [Flavobacterium antarcticum]|uniref:hypothetical protein n=1 Tax=Flavobacterium antarcticum TaxID=271155 RepID=UPI0003B6A7D0|nr:hypothetical protein [Flavobacterium antarcticum]